MVDVSDVPGLLDVLDGDGVFNVPDMLDLLDGDSALGVFDVVDRFGRFDGLRVQRVWRATGSTGSTTTACLMAMACRMLEVLDDGGMFDVFNVVDCDGVLDVFDVLDGFGLDGLPVQRVGPACGSVGSTGVACSLFSGFDGQWVRPARWVRRVRRQRRARRTQLARWRRCARQRRRARTCSSASRNGVLDSGTPNVLDGVRCA